MPDLASELRRYVDRASTITLDEVSIAQRPRPRRRRTLVVGVVCCCIAATALAILATRKPSHHGVSVVGVPDSSIPRGDTPTSRPAGGPTPTPLVTGTVTFERLKPGDALALGDTALVDVTLRNNSDHSLALVHDGAAVFAWTCDNSQGLTATQPEFRELANTFHDVGGKPVNITPPLAPGKTINDFDGVKGHAIGTMTCRIVVKGNNGWSSLDPPVSASLQIVPATVTTTTP